jgi:hypothetical protein
MKIKDTLKTILVLLLAVSMTAVVGTSELTDVNQPETNDNDQRMPPQAVSLAHESPKTGKNGGTSGPNKGHGRSNKRNRYEVSLAMFRKTNKAGTKFHARAWRKTGLPKPHARMITSVKRMYSMKERGTICELLQDEVSRIESDAAILKDPAYRLSYVSHCLLNYGGAVRTVKKYDKGFKDLDVQFFTITPKNIISALTGAFKDLPSPYRLSVFDYQVRTNDPKVNYTGLTPFLHQKLVGRSVESTGLIALAAKKIINSTADKDYNDYVVKGTKADELKSAAKLRYDNMNEEFKEFGMLTSELNVKYNSSFIKLKSFAEIVSAGGNAAQATMVQEAIASFMKNLENDASPLDSFEQFKEAKYAAKFKELKHEVKPTQVIRMMNGNKITLQWHLTHMSDWKKSQKTVVKNNHTGACFLFGPSNMVQIPNDVKPTKSSEGYRELTGDTVAYQLIKAAHLSEWTNAHKNSSTELYFMQQMSLDEKPNVACKVIGLYTHPDVVNNFDHEAPALATVKAKIPKPVKASKGNKGNRKGPNTRKNQKVNAVKQAKRDSEEMKVSKEELAKHAPAKDVPAVPFMDDDAVRDLLDSPSLKAATCPVNEKSVMKDLLDYAREQGLTGVSKMRKSELLGVVTEHFGNQIPVDSMKKEVSRKAKKGRKAPPAANRKPSD